MQHIVVFHPGAIGDVTLATPVAIALNNYFPRSRIIYWTHESLSELLSFCGAIDRVVPYERKAGIIKQVSVLRGLKPDLLVNLSGSLTGRLLAFLAGIRACHYKKERKSSGDQMHAVENFLNTISELGVSQSESVFPTLAPDDTCMESARVKMRESGIDIGAVDGGTSLLLVGLVPGVGRFRPHRAWTKSGWEELAKRLLDTGKLVPVIIGGPDEEKMAAELADSIGAACRSLAGKLSLSQTAAVLKLCSLVVSGDTGPAHISVAVGTPVVGLYGATFPQRSGPYGCDDLLIDKSQQCRCHHQKKCRVEGVEGPGDCMRSITCDEVWEKIMAVLDKKV